jgi:hypothetical protein
LTKSVWTQRVKRRHCRRRASKKRGCKIQERANAEQRNALVPVASVASPFKIELTKRPVSALQANFSHTALA